MTKRMMAALVALAGLFIALYLTLYKLGVIGQITCSIGSCETVQTSRWATFLGLPVAAWGVGYYLAVLAVTIAGSTDRWADSRGVSLVLLALTGWGALFSAWLTYLELFVIDAICQWCVVSALLSLVLLVLAVLDYRELRLEADPVGGEAA
ncbi:MAG TPA: vitamin K epoxide reductase family protein [Gemmatimonadaceae bacterium]|nr:vitamin K epoxide reductase family protein [Gemmatimonadaceae bacterium]